MGNSIAKKFDIPEENTATAGHLQLWKIWPGTNKATKKAVSVWVFDKGDLSKRKINPVTDKAHLEQIHAIMRKDMLAMKELTSSNIIQVLEILEDGKNLLAFTTERVVCSIADIMTRFGSISGGASSVASYLEGYLEPNGTMSEIELGRGILNVCEAVQYLHNISKKIHMSVSPESVVITATGQWKVCNLGLSCAMIPSEAVPTVASPYFLKSVAPGTPRLEPDLAYCAPEMAEGGSNPTTVRNVTAAADVFSLGMLAYEVYRFNFRLIPEGKLYVPTVCVPNNSADRHEEGLIPLKTLDCSFLSQAVQPLIVNMTQTELRFRMSTVDVANNQYFSSGSLAVLKTIDSLHGRDGGAQAAQLVSLGPQLNTFTPRILENLVLQSICKLSEANPGVWPFLFPVLDAIKGRCSIERLRERTSVYFEAGLALTSPPDTVQAFLKNYEFIMDTFDGPFFTANFTSNLLCNALDMKTSVVTQGLAFSVLGEERVRLSIDNTTLTEKIVPKACREACKNSDPRIKMQALYVLSLVCSRLDDVYLSKNILPSLKYILDHEKDPSVSLSVIGNYAALADCVDAQIIATAILPTIQPLLIDKSMSAGQFQQVVYLMKLLLARVLSMRGSELGIVASLDNIGADTFDPFQSARALMAPVKPSFVSASINQGGPPPLPGMPPPLPSSPPPLPVSVPPPIPAMPPPPVPSSAPPPVPINSYAFTSPPMSTPPVPPVPPPPPSDDYPTFDNPFASGSSGSTPPAVPPAVPASNSVSSSSSTFSWLTGSSKSSSASSAASTAAPYSSASSSSIISSTPSYLPPSSSVQSSGPTDIIDEEDFLASFGKSSIGPSVPTTPSVPAVINETNFMSATVAAKPVSKSGITKKAPLVKIGTARNVSSGSTGNDGSLLDMPAAPVVSVAPSLGLSSSLTTEQQILQTQAEIARVNSQMQQFQQPTAPTPQQAPPAPMQFPNSNIQMSSNNGTIPPRNLNFSNIGMVAPANPSANVGQPALQPNSSPAGMNLNMSMTSGTMGMSQAGGPGTNLAYGGTPMGATSNMTNSLPNAGMAMGGTGYGMSNGGMGMAHGSMGIPNSAMGMGVSNPGMGMPNTGMGMPNAGMGMQPMGYGGMNPAMGGYPNQQTGMQQGQFMPGNMQQPQYGNYGNQAPQQVTPNYGQPISYNQMNPGVYRPPQMMPTQPQQQAGRVPPPPQNQNRNTAFDFLS